ncbi:hypothetical protein [Glaciecola petra]|uniref:Uncharacterized protein n=1 Tax=Glaciecola petra TaxID=3075602 RepID=A0ABU2ZPV3_9ALTE|nr:hypothetical protein [Aestuariibacter sp. P117]MDT0593629.1 hypothetical protein [Aestuariibacter sp. P117]
MHQLSQLHIEAARNSSDDFNLFHDKNRWRMVPNNPFGGPIALGFQLGCYIETQIDAMRSNAQIENSRRTSFPFSAYELSFAGTVCPNDIISLNVKPTKTKQTNEGLVQSNRLLLMSKKDNQRNKPVIIGSKKEYEKMPHIIEGDFPSFTDIKTVDDRSFIANSQYFLKHKYMIVGNAKNFLTSAFAEQSDYIDEFEDKVNFPEMYPLGLLSSALLERAKADEYDLRKNPMIFVSHQLIINKSQLAKLRSNDRLDILVSEQLPIANNEQKKLHYCLAYANDKSPLFQARVELMPLKSLLDNQARN